MEIKNWVDFLLTENIQRAKAFISKKMESWEKLKIILQPNPGYIGKFTEYLFDENIRIEDLEATYNSLIELKRKGRTIDIDKYTYEKLTDVIISERNSIKINSVINKFPSFQKNLIRSQLNNNSNKMLILKLADKENLQNFISKISRYKTLDHLLDAIKIFLRSIENEKSEIIKKVENLKYSDIVVDKNNILIVRVGKFDDIEHIASDCSWCILQRSHWNNYTSNGRRQFVIFDYNKDTLDRKFKIGITLTESGAIHATHDMMDNSLNSYIKDYLKSFDIDIIDLLAPPKKENIDLSKINITSSISNKKLTDILKLSTDNQIKEILNKLIGKNLKINLNYGTVQQWIEKHMESIGKKYYTEEELEKEFPGTIEWFYHNSNTVYHSFNFINKKIANINSINKFIKGLWYWEDEVLLRLDAYISPKTLESYMSLFKENRSIFENIHKRLLSIDILKIKKIATNEDNFNFKSILYIYLAVLWVKEDMGEKLKNKEFFILNHIIRILPDNFKSNFRKRLNYGIDLRYDWPKTKEEVEEVIKKDYSVAIGYVQIKDFDIFYDILKRLNGKKVSIGIRLNSQSRDMFIQGLKNYLKGGRRKEVVEFVKSMRVYKRFTIFTTKIEIY